MMDKPLYRVAAAGLDPRDARLIEIVFRHSQYNRYAFEFVPTGSFESVDILIVNTVEAEGLRALARMRTLGADVPVVAAVPRGAPSSSRYAISIDRLTLQLLPILNRVVELELVDPETRPMSVDSMDARARASAAAPVPAPARTPAPAPVASPAPAASRPPALAVAGASPVARGVADPLGPSGRPAAPARAAGAAPPRVAPPAGRAPAPAPTAPASPSPQPSRPPLVAPRPAGFPPASRELPRRRAGAPAAPATPAAAGPAAAARPVAPPPAAGRATSASPATTGDRPGSPPPAQPRPGLPRVQVLVVDDSPTVRRQLTLAFERMGVACDAVPSAVAGLERMSAIRYDLVLVDVVMPEVDGYQLTREIRRRHRGIPVIILTSRSSPFDLARGALAGCASYLVKPVTLRKLEAAVIKVLRKTLAIDDLSGLIRPISLYAPASSRPSEPDRSRGPAGRA